MTEVTARIEKFLAATRQTVHSFEESIGASNGTIANAIKRGKNVSIPTISKIIETYPSLSAEWLLTGRGEMFHSSDSYTQTVSGNHSAASINGNATAGDCLANNERISFLERILEEKERTIQILMQQFNK